MSRKEEYVIDKKRRLIAASRLEALEAEPLFTRMYESAEPEWKDAVLQMWINICRGDVKLLSSFTRIDENELRMLKRAMKKEKKPAKKSVDEESAEGPRHSAMAVYEKAIKGLKYLFHKTGTYSIREALQRDNVARIVGRQGVSSMSAGSRINCGACGVRITNEGVVHHYTDSSGRINPGFTGRRCCSIPYELAAGVAPSGEMLSDLEIITRNLEKAKKQPDKYCIVKEPAYLRRVLTARDEMLKELAKEHAGRVEEHKAKLYAEYVLALQDLEQAVNEGDADIVIRMLQHEGEAINVLAKKAEELGEWEKEIVRKYRSHEPLEAAENAFLLSLYAAEVRVDAVWYFGSFSEEIAYLKNRKRLAIVGRSGIREEDEEMLRSLRDEGKVAVYEDRYKEAKTILEKQTITLNEYVRVISSFPGIEEARGELHQKIEEKYRLNPETVYLTVFKALRSRTGVPKAVQRMAGEAFDDFTLGKGSVPVDAEMVLDRIYYSDLKPEGAGMTIEARQQSRQATSELLEKLGVEKLNKMSLEKREEIIFADRLYAMDKWHYSQQLRKMKEDGTLEWLSGKLWYRNIRSTVKHAIPARRYAQDYPKLVVAYRVLARKDGH